MSGSSSPVDLQVAPATTVAPTEIAFSCRLPLLVLFVSAAVWLVIGSAFSLIASIKFHSPGFLADCPWLTYGRVYPAYLNSLLYGCCVQAGLGVALWVFTHLGFTKLVQRGLVTFGAALWNFGVTIGIVGILTGESTGFEMLELPTYGSLFVFLGYLLIGVWAAVTFHQRRVRPLFVSQWYLFTALFWFPWIYSTAQLLLVIFPLRGVAQSVIAWWFSANLLGVWLGLAGLAALFYFIPKLTNLELHSHYLAVFTFWMLLVFGGWGGIHNSAPVPAWMPALSTVSTVLLLVPILAVAINIHRTLEGNFGKLAAHPSFPFFMFGAAAFIFAGLMKVAEAIFDTQQQLHFTWFNSAQKELYIYGFFVMAIYGVVYRVLPQLTATELPWPKLVRVHFWLAAAGILLLVVPLAIGGIIQAQQLADPAINFLNITKSSLMFLRVSTVGILLLALGNLLLVANLLRLVRLFYQAKVATAYATVTADLFKTAEVKP